MSRRMQRVAELLKSEIARVLLEEVTDPRIGMVTLTRVDCAPDLSNAIVYWSAVEAKAEASIESISDGLASAAPFVRGRIARALSLRRTPRLSFRYDPSLEQGAEMASLLRKLADDETP